MSLRSRWRIGNFFAAPVLSQSEFNRTLYLATSPETDWSRLRCLSQLLLNRINVGKGAADFLRKGGVPLEKIGAFSPHPFQ